MTINDLQPLLSRPERSTDSILSVYMNVDQSRQVNLNRGFETQLGDLLLDLRKTMNGGPDSGAFAIAEKRVKEFLALYQPHSQGLAMFFDAADNFFWSQEINFSLTDEARWDREFYTKPLANAMDQFKAYGVALIDRENLRLFAVSLGRIEECGHKRFESGRTRHIKSAGTDHIESASQIQRKADEQVRANLRRDILLIATFAQDKRLDHIVLAGAPEITAALSNLLPKRLSSRVIGAVNLPITSASRDVLAATQHIADQYERATEMEIVHEVVTASAKKFKAVIGLEPTLKALNANRVWQFVYSSAYSAPGFECAQCGALFSTKTKACPHCRGSVVAVADVVERAVGHAVRSNVSVEVVTEDAAAYLNEAGSIGAFLKTRTASVRL